MKKKLLAILLTVLTLCISAFCFTACGDGQGGGQGGQGRTEELTYVQIEGKEEYAVNGLKEGADGDIVIPSTYKGLPVTGINEGAFAECTSLTSIVIPNSVESVGNNAFEYCVSITIYCEALEQPSGWDSDWNIDNCPVVWDCKNNDVADDGNIYVVISNIRYALKEGQATVAKQAKNITKAKIPESVTYKSQNYPIKSIGESAFEDCKALKSIEISNSVRSIGDSAVRVCTALTSIKIGENVESIGDYVFIGCEALTSIEIPNSVKSIGGSVFSLCTALTSVVIGNNVESIGFEAFYGCSSLTSIEIPNSVEIIGNNAFEYCASLTIYCEATAQPSGWDRDWNIDNCPVVWDCKNK